MRKAIAFFMVLLMFCCSVPAALTAGGEAALAGLSDGVMSAVASYLSEPRIALQGVTVVQGEGVVPLRISFVRSDVSTYAASLSFFDQGMSMNGSTEAVTPLPEMLPTDLVQNWLQWHDFAAGDIVLDGSVRLLEGEAVSAAELAAVSDWSFFHVRFSLSIMATGALAGGGSIIEGVVDIYGEEGRTMRVEAGNLTVDGETISAEPVFLSFGG